MTGPCGTVCGMRILIVGDPGQPHTQRWAEGLRDAGASVRLAGFGDDPGIDLPFCALGSAELRDRRYPRAVPALRRLIRRWRPDVVHAHFVSSYGVLSWMAAGAVPVVQFAWGSDVLWHDQRARWHRTLVERTLRRAALVIVDAEEVGATVATLAPATSVDLVRYGPPLDWTSASRTERRMILSPRQLKPFYNVDVVVRAFAESGAMEAGWTLEVLSGGSSTAALEALVDTLEIVEAVRFWPRVTRGELQRLFLDAAIVCSVPSSDATSVALLEGMATGAYPIVSDLAANRALILSGTNGSIVPVGEVAPLAAAIAAAIDDVEGRARAASRNRQWVAANASWESAVASVAAASSRIAGDV